MPYGTKVLPWSHGCEKQSRKDRNLHLKDEIMTTSFDTIIWIAILIAFASIAYALFRKAKLNKDLMIIKTTKTKSVKLNVQKELTKAISVRQPYAELIMMGEKIIEYRTIPTNIRGRIYIYASNTLAKDEEDIRKTNKSVEELPRGVLVGSVEIINCTGSKADGFSWHLEKPVRLETLLKPVKKPQPVWFNPF